MLALPRNSQNGKSRKASGFVFSSTSSDSQRMSVDRRVPSKSTNNGTCASLAGGAGIDFCCCISDCVIVFGILEGLMALLDQTRYRHSGPRRKAATVAD